jgi:hypothetical protein
MWVGAIVLVLLAVRIALPFALCRSINNRLARVEGYSGSVASVDLQLFRGAYRLNEVSILKQDASGEEPFFDAESVDFSIAWGELFDGHLVSDIFLVAPRMQITRTAIPPDPKEEGRRWQEVIQDIFPIEITHLEVSRGEFRFVDPSSTPRVDIALRDFHAVATGLRNTATQQSGPFPAVLSAKGVTIGDGQFDLFAQADPLADQPRFQLKLDLKDVDLPALNDFLEAYANVDVSAGKFQLYVEMNAANGAFDGYVKPFADHVEFKNISDGSKGILRRLWESIVSGVSSIVENEDREQVATRIPFSGRFGDPKVGVWATIVNLVGHGFGSTLSEGLDEEPPPTQGAVNSGGAEGK